MNFNRYILPILICIILIFESQFSYSQVQNNYYQKGSIAFQRENYLEAIKFFSYEIQIDANSFRSYYLRGLTKINLDDLIGADQDFSSAIMIAPYFSDFYFNRALVRSELNNYKASFKDYETAIDIDSLNPEIYFRRAQTNLNLKKYDKVILDCVKMFELKFYKENVYIISGIAKSGIGNHRNGLSDLNVAINYNPDNIYSITQRANIYQELNLNDSALIDLNYAIELDSSYSYAYFARAAVWSKLDSSKLAISDLDKVIKLSPYNSFAYFNRAIILSSLEKKFEAINDYNTVIQLNPSHIMSYFYRGRMRYDMGNYIEAEKDYTKTIKLYPEFADAYQARQIVRSKLNDLEGAKQDLQKYMSLNEDGDLNLDTKSQEKADYLKSLIKLSGDFVNIKSANKKVQYQHIDINILDVFSVSYRNIEQKDTYFYDAINHLSAYHTPVVTISNISQSIDLETANKYIEQYKLLIDSTSFNPSYYLNRALVNINIEDFNQTFEDLNKIIKERPNYGIAYFVRANASLKLIELLTNFDKSEPSISINKNEKIEAINETFSIKEHSYEDVIKDFDKSLAIDPSFSFAYYNRAYTKAINGDIKNAIKDFSEAIKLNKNFPEAFYNRGLLRIYMNDKESGCKDLSKSGEMGLNSAYNVMKRYCFK